MRLLSLTVLLVGWVLGAGCGPWCADDEVAREVCVQCGASGGCARTEQCAKKCTGDADCASGLVCSDDVCEVPGCF